MLSALARRRFPPRRHARLLAAVMGLAAVTFAASQGYTAESWANCGGSQFCPCGTSNCDGQWPGVVCKTEDACMRQNPTWWRCEPRADVCWRTVETWSACGGSHNCPSGSSTCDAPWRGSCCKHGAVCARQSESWWRCEPVDHYSSAQLCYSFASTWASCGDKTCCASVGDKCVYKSPGWSRCEPVNDASPAQPPRGSPPPPLEVHGNRVVTPTGAEVALHGINWFGYNVARQMVDGLGHGGSNAETDFAAIVYQLRLLGYNTVRLPFRYRDLDHPDPKDYTVRCWGMSKEAMRQRLMMPGEWTERQLPLSPPAVGRDAAGYCNSYLPSSSTYDRLMYTIQVFVSQGMYVMLDYQPMETEPQPYNLKEFVCKWRVLMSRVTALPNWATDIKGRVLVDIMNEPDSMHMRWEASDRYPGVRELYLSTMDALHDVSRDGWLYIIQGTGQNAFGLNWGNGFITDANIIRKYGLSDPNYFFQQLLDKPYAHRVVISPHVYPPSITKSVFLGDALWQQCSIAFGYLQTRGYCQGSQCRVFPVIVGETGSFMKDKTDVQWLADFADFVAARGGARAYNWAPAAGWLWWAYNENSGDTGGIVWDNWSKLDWTKLRYMINSLGLHPWYKWRQ